MLHFRLLNIFKRTGFPPVLSDEVELLKAAITDAKQRGLDPQYTPEVQNIVRRMITLMPFVEKFRELEQVVRADWIIRETKPSDDPEVKASGQRIILVSNELFIDRHCRRFYKYLQHLGISELPFLGENTYKE
ncbi:hypothetical protein [aff. Roholtiella sp. LEGE 12411]|uniref:hypothetical protein n=1 Tax=aff. Roholtiella sp. LEGE 12411 TaxID=1828822 RepID=UPI00187EFF62|nr:hypothetical protein [aff. Roholtiella sp. LEGE 12411]MBE9036105.1 hypothetical protein [aff. Roholtiella sp. LEGE 12411]